MRLNIINSENTLFTGECTLVQVPGISGQFEILDRHAPIISLLGQGKIKVQTPDEKETFFDIEGSGIVKVNKNQVAVLISG